MNKNIFSILSLVILLFSFTAHLAADTPKSTTYMEQPIPLPEELKEADVGGGESRFMSEFFNMLITLSFIVVLLYAATWFFKRMTAQRTMQMNETSNIKVLEQRPLSPKSALYIVEVLGKTMLISESLNGVKFLAELPESDQ